MVAYNIAKTIHICNIFCFAFAIVALFIWWSVFEEVALFAKLLAWYCTTQVSPKWTRLSECGPKCQWFAMQEAHLTYISIAADLPPSGVGHDKNRMESASRSCGSRSKINNQWGHLLNCLTEQIWYCIVAWYYLKMIKPSELFIHNVRIVRKEWLKG